MKIILTIALVSGLSDRAVAKEWACWDPLDSQRRVVVRLEEYQHGDISNAIYETTGRQIATVHFADAEQPADFAIQGLNRRWDFGWEYGILDKRAAPYAFVINPSGHGQYYDFSRGPVAMPSQVYDCEIR